MAISPCDSPERHGSADVNATQGSALVRPTGPQLTDNLGGPSPTSVSRPAAIPAHLRLLPPGRVGAARLLEEDRYFRQLPPPPPVLAWVADKILRFRQDALSQGISPPQAAEMRRRAEGDLAKLREQYPEHHVTIDVLSWVVQQTDPCQLPSAHNPHGDQLLEAVAAAALQGTRQRAVQPQNIVTEGNHVFKTVLQTGEEISAMQQHLIEGACRSISMEFYLFNKTSEGAKYISQGLANLQLRLAKQRDVNGAFVPLTLDIVVDSLHGCLGKTLESGGVRGSRSVEDARHNVVFYHNLLMVPIDPSLITLRIYAHEHLLRGTLHSKIFLVDGHTAMISTANVRGNHHFATMNEQPMHDAAIVMQGPVSSACADDLQGYIKSSVLLADNRKTPTFSYDELQMLFTKAAKNLQLLPMSTDAQIHAHNSQRTQEKVAHLVQEMQQADSSGETSRVVAVAQRPRTVLYGRVKNTPQRLAYLAAIHHAQQTIEINTVNLNVDEVVHALKQALDRGVHVSILTPYRANDTYYAKLGLDNESIYIDHLLAYVHKSKPSGRLSLRYHMDSQGHRSANANHTKVMFVDRSLVIFGSANLDNQSYKYSGEFNVAISDPKVVDVLYCALFAPFWEHGYDFA